MNLPGRDFDPAKTQVAGGTGVVGKNDFKPVIRGRPDGRLDAHVRLHAADNEAFNGVLSQIIQELGFAKTVGLVLDDDLFVGQGSDVGTDRLGRVGAVCFKGNMADVDHR